MLRKTETLLKKVPRVALTSEMPRGFPLRPLVTKKMDPSTGLYLNLQFSHLLLSY
jgi:hypothetical protein